MTSVVDGRRPAKSRTGLRTAWGGGRKPGSLRGCLALAVGLVFVLTSCVVPPPGRESSGGTTPPSPNSPASATASASQREGTVPFTTSFSSAGSVDPDGTIVGYSWNFGDGTASSDPNPVKTYTASGTFTVWLTVTDDGGISVTSWPVVITVRAADGSADNLVQFPALGPSVGVGEDRFAVWTCEIPGHPYDPAVLSPTRVAQWARDNAGQWFETASRGRYHPVFVAEGVFAVADASGNPMACLDEARARTHAPYTNVLVVDTWLDSQTTWAGLGSAGFVRRDGTGYAPALPPSESRRGIIVRGVYPAYLPGANPLIHEIGHSLHWPHSYFGSSPYDNPVDIMSGGTTAVRCRSQARNPRDYYCDRPHTLAFNRWASGWIDPAEVVVHQGGGRQVLLAGPEATGTQLLVAPSTTSPKAMLTIEARPAAGWDVGLRVGGVAVHVVDQRPERCSGMGEVAGSCPSLWRRQGQVVGPSYQYEHVLVTGETQTFHGLTISVGPAIGSGWLVSVSGSATIPGNAQADELNESNPQYPTEAVSNPDPS